MTHRLSLGVAMAVGLVLASCNTTTSGGGVTRAPSKPVLNIQESLKLRYVGLLRCGYGRTVGGGAGRSDAAVAAALGGCGRELDAFVKLVELKIKRDNNWRSLKSGVRPALRAKAVAQARKDLRRVL